MASVHGDRYQRGLIPIEEDIIHQVHLDKHNIILVVPKSHNNLVEAFKYDTGQIITMVSTMGYFAHSGGWRYMTPLCMILGKEKMENGWGKPETDLERWMEAEWDILCKKKRVNKLKNITFFGPLVRDFNNPKVNGVMFLDFLLKRQDGFLEKHA